LTITGNTAQIIYDGFALFQQTVEEGALSDIGSAYDGNGIAHKMGISV
jgi:hypothetical protein